MNWHSVLVPAFIISPFTPLQWLHAWAGASETAGLVSAAAAAKSLGSWDSPGKNTCLEWVAISFASAWKWRVKVKSLALTPPANIHFAKEGVRWRVDFWKSWVFVFLTALWKQRAAHLFIHRPSQAATCRLAVVALRRGYCLSWACRPCRLLWAQGSGSRSAASVAAGLRLRCSAARRIPLDRGSNPCPLRRQADS